MHVLAGLFQVQTDALCSSPCLRYLGVVVPTGLGLQHSLQHFFMEILLTRRLKHPRHFFRTLMEQYIAQHQTYIFRVLGEDLLHIGVEGAACLARRIEEFDDGHWSLRRTEHW